jgi:hypothetical protein
VIKITVVSDSTSTDESAAKCTGRNKDQYMVKIDVPVYK